MARNREVYVPLSDTNVSLNCEGVTRRRLLQAGAMGLGGYLLGNQFGSAAEPPAKPAAPAPSTASSSGGREPKAKAVIQIWLSGGPTHTDTFDPKPDSGADYTGPLNHPIETNVKGIRIGEMLPELAKVADKYSIIRSMTHGQNGHETAAYMVQTGRMPGGRLVYPAVGAVVTAFKGFEAGSQNLIPPYIVLTQPQGRFSEAGFMGIKYKPFATGGDPNSMRFAVEGIVAPGITDDQQQARRDQLEQMDGLSKALRDNPEILAAKKAEKEAYDLIIGDAGKVFDLSPEKDELRLRYGKNTFGQACLAARRLIEKGVKFVTINQFVWDTHKEHFPAMRRLLPNLDKGVATLLADLADHGLLDSTIVWCGGEFGRTPKVAWESPWNGGRHHFGSVFSTLVAGGGFKGGQVVGASDANGEEVRDRPVYPGDLIGSIYELLGIDPQANLPHPMNEIVKATPTPEEGVKLAGRLKEIM
ncbi:MAG: DUF1501 domain-containing protein [Thermoguttaceae bacterium]|jgi:hypothetical protein